MTDKLIMEDNYNKVVDALYNAVENLKNAESILNSDLVINDFGYCANEISERIAKLQEYKRNVENRILPAIKKL